MEALKLYNYRNIEKLISKREGETKYGEKVAFITDLEELEKKAANFVLFGIPEDIGVRANSGKPGAARAWQTCLKNLLNVQANEFTQPEDLILLGEINCDHWMQKASNFEKSDPNYYEKLGDLVKEIDQAVSQLVEKIILAGKTPVIIGGGHNNAYGNIKGASKACKKPLNVLNIDAHTDLRQLEHRHSGNGFSFAQYEGFLGKYGIFGLHENYTPQYIFEEIKASGNIQFRLIEELMPHNREKVEASFRSLLEFTASSYFGLEIDCDAIANFPSSAKSPSGFDIQQVRDFIRITAKEENCRYLHLCEAAPGSKEAGSTGKALAYFITDFTKR